MRARLYSGSTRLAMMCASGRTLIRAGSTLELQAALDAIGQSLGLGHPPDDLVERMDTDEKAKLPRRGHTTNAIKAM